MASHIYTSMTSSLSLSLHPRKLFGSSSSSNDTKATCTLPDATILQNPTTSPLAGNLDFYTLTEIITGACAAFTLLSMALFTFRHATHLSRPNEQLNVLRIAAYLPILAIGSFVQIAAPASFVYLDPWLDFAQSVALCNFFLLMCQYVSPSDDRREMFFAGLQAPSSSSSSRSRRNKRNQMQQQQQQEQQNSSDTSGGGGSGLHWYRRMWLLIFQYPLVSLLVAIFTDITEAAHVYCLTSSSAHFAHLWLNLAHTGSLVLAVTTSLRLCRHLKQPLAHHRPLRKLLAFKALVGLDFLVTIVYWILRSVNPSPFHTTAQLSWFDLYAGIPTMIIAIACVPFSVFFWFAYPVAPYYLENVHRNIPLAQHHQYDDLESHPLSSSGGGGGGGNGPEHRSNNHSSSDGSHGNVDDDVARGKFRRQHHHDSPANIISTAGSSYQGGFLGMNAFVGMLNPVELISGFMFGFTMLNKRNRATGAETARRAQTGGFDRYY